MEQKLKGKVALVTGAGRGIGRAHALRLANLGADVAINDIDLHSYKQFTDKYEKLTADSTVDEVRKLGRHSLGIECDVANKKQVDEMFEKILKEFGHIDIVVNNAGGLQLNPETSYASSVPEVDLRRELDRNLMSCIFCCQAASIPMKQQKSGRIVNTASVAGTRVDPKSNGYYSSYQMAKIAIIHYTRSLASELGPFGINVNCIAPGLIGTARMMLRSYDNAPGRREEVEQGIPLRRLGTSEDIAKAMEFLVTDLSDYITGQTIRVCGGTMLY